MKPVQTLALLAATTVLTACGGTGSNLGTLGFNSSDGQVDDSADDAMSPDDSMTDDTISPGGSTLGGTANGTPTTAEAQLFAGSGPVTISEIGSLGSFLNGLEPLIESGQVDLLSQDELTATGAGTYNGFMLAESDETGDSFVGRAAVNANFANETLSGSVTDIQIFSDNVAVFEIDGDDDVVSEAITNDVAVFDVAGSLALSGGGLTIGEDNQGQVAIDVSGSVTIPQAATMTDSAETYGVEGSINGALLSNGTFGAGGTVDAAGDDETFSIDMAIFAQ